jgi:hypothetical protein
VGKLGCHQESLPMKSNLIISYEQLRRRVCTHYNVEELCDIMELTPEDIFDQMFDQKLHISKVGDVLTELDYEDIIDG